MAGQNVDKNLGLGLSLGGLYQQGRTVEALEDRAMSVAGDVKEENGPPPEKLAVRHQPRAISMPTFRELHEMNSNMKGVGNLTMCLAAESKKLTAGDQKEMTDTKGASVLLHGLPGGATYGTGSGRVAASSSTVASEISSSDGSGEQSRDITAMVISTKKKVTADEETELDTPTKRARVFNCNNNVVWRAGMARMPSVNTTGADGKKVEGFLYKYLDAPVSIVCVCHGKFFSPAEFINHAGGEKVTNPLKKIAVALYK